MRAYNPAAVHGKTDRDGNVMPSQPLKGGDSMSNYGATKDDNWRKRSNAKPLTITRK